MLYLIIICFIYMSLAKKIAEQKREAKRLIEQKAMMDEAELLSYERSILLKTLINEIIAPNAKKEWLYWLFGKNKKNYIYQSNVQVLLNKHLDEDLMNDLKNELEDQDFKVNDIELDESECDHKCDFENETDCDVLDDFQEHKCNKYCNRYKIMPYPEGYYLQRVWEQNNAQQQLHCYHKHNPECCPFKITVQNPEISDE